MAREPDPQVRAEWQSRMARYRRSDLAVADFCADEGISTAAFY